MSTERAVSSLRMDASPWLDGSVPQNMRAYKDVELQVAGLAGGDTITVTRSLNGTDYVAPTWIDQALSTGTVIGANGLYSFDGFALLKWARTGQASAPTIHIRGSN